MASRVFAIIFWNNGKKGQNAILAAADALGLFVAGHRLLRRRPEMGDRDVVSRAQPTLAAVFPLFGAGNNSAR